MFKLNGTELYLHNLFLVDSQVSKLEMTMKIQDFANKFCEDFEEKFEKMEQAHHKELIELNFLRANYERLMKRLDLYKQHQVCEKKTKKKVARKIKKQQFDRILSNVQDNSAFTTD